MNFPIKKSFVKKFPTKNFFTKNPPLDDTEDFEFFDLSRVVLEIKSQYLDSISSDEVFSVWKDIVGEPLSLYSKVFSYEKKSGTILVCSNDGMCISEISGRKNKIIQEYKRRFPKYLFKSLETRFFYNM